jgi:redox-sensitive bicupin YhaK (pirin superfamily)
MITTEKNIKAELIKSNNRGFANHGWLKSHHSFSFADYYEPNKINFGALRVLNDDTIAGAMGFGMHPHANMEIITIVLDGELKHADNMGISEIVVPDEIQIMSAGTGIMHSEHNNKSNSELNLLQIWVLPKQKDITPRYDQKKFDPELRKNKFQLLVSPKKSDQTLWINQDAYFSLASIEMGNTLEYNKNKTENGVYLFVIEGAAHVNEYELNKRDALAVSEFESLKITATKNTNLLAIEIPMY